LGDEGATDEHSRTALDAKAVTNGATRAVSLEARAAISLLMSKRK